MNYLGIDAGTTGCKVALVTPRGEILALAYREYDPQSPHTGWAQLDSVAVWENLKSAICEVTHAHPHAEIKALAISSLGEALVPVSADRKILGPSILNFDKRGQEFLAGLASQLPDDRLYAITGNILANLYSLTKLKWIRTYQPGLYDGTYKFLLWSSFIAFMLGAEPAVDFSLANRTLLFDIHCGDWSDAMLEIAGLDREKLPDVLPAGKLLGSVSARMAAELGLPPGVQIINGTHDQCANALGCGAIDPGITVFGMGTFHCLTPVFDSLPDPQLMITRGLNTEHHAVPGKYVCFIYNQGGVLVKWVRDTFAAAESLQADAAGQSIYPALLAEMPLEPSSVIVLPHFTQTGPPRYIADSSGLVSGLRLETQRGELLKGIIEGAAFYLEHQVDSLADTGINIDNYRAVGGGSRSDIWVQVCADIFGKAVARPAVHEAGALGAAIVAGVGVGEYSSFSEAVTAMVRVEHVFEPDLPRHARYQAHYQSYLQLEALAAEYRRDSAGRTT